MKVSGIILIVFGALGLLLSMVMYGDIAVAGIIGSVSGLVSGIGLVTGSKAIKKLNK